MKKGGGVAAPDHVRPASLALQPFAQADPTNQRLEPKSYKMGLVLVIIRLTTISLMYLMMRTFWSMMTQLQQKIKQIIRKKVNKTLLANNLKSLHFLTFLQKVHHFT